MEDKHILNKNLDMLRDLGWDITKMKELADVNFKVKLTESKEAVPALLLEREGQQFYIHSKYKPLEEAKRLTKDITAATKNIVVFGIGLGYHIREILDTVSADAKILVVLPDYSLFQELICLWDYTEIISDKRVCLHAFKDKATTKSIIDSYLDWKRMNSIEFLYISNYKNIFPAELEDTIQALRETISINHINENTKVRFSNDWQVNYFENMPYIFKSTPLTYFLDEFKNIPAIIVSAGPSLNKNVHLLAELKNKALILSTDSALKVLLKNNIKPHLVFTIDGGVLTYEKFSGIECSDIPMVFQNLSNEKIIKGHQGKKIFFTKGDELTKLFEEKNMNTIMPVGGSVATAAFSMACYVGADPVVFIGQDLAFTEERTHAVGTMYDEETFQRHHDKLVGKTQKQYVMVKGNYEEKVKTDPVYRSYLIWFQDVIKTQMGMRHFINATEGGAYIEGTEVMTLGAVKDQYCITEHSIEKKIQEILEKELPFSKEELEGILLKHTAAGEELANIKKKAQLAVKYLCELEEIYKDNKLHSKKIKQLLSKLNTLDRYIKKQEESTSFIELILQRKIVEADFSLFRAERPDETEQEMGLRIIKGNSLLYNGIIGCIDMVDELFEEYLNKMREFLGGVVSGY